jgi:sugar phosphate isomerase/epimerase
MKFPDNITIISDEVSQDLPVISAFVREFRLPGIELRSLNGRAFKDLTRSDIAEVNTASRAEGWRVVGCATPVFKCDLDDTTAIAAHRDIFKRSLEVAHELNADLLRVFTFLRTPHPAEPAKQQRVIEHLHGLVADGAAVAEVEARQAPRVRGEREVIQALVGDRGADRDVEELEGLAALGEGEQNRVRDLSARDLSNG